jgi:hypothetical protein
MLTAMLLTTSEVVSTVSLFLSTNLPFFSPQSSALDSSVPPSNLENFHTDQITAMQWESSGVYVWFFPRGSIPSDITDGAPVTGNWGLPIVAFNGGSSCNIDSFFANENIVFDTTFCGDVWSPFFYAVESEGSGC